MIKIKLDKRNTNKHTEENLKLLEKSIEEVGVIERLDPTLTIKRNGVVINKSEFE